MRTILLALLIFSASTLGAQPYTPTENRELPRGELMPYASAADADMGAANHRYGASIPAWNREEGRFTAEFTVPFAWTNRQVFVRVAHASADYEVLINGHRIGRNADPNTPADFNITKQVREGRNHIEILTSTDSALAPVEGWKKGTEEPDLGAVELFSSPTMGVRDVLVKSWFGEESSVANAEIGIVVKSYALNPRTVRIYYELLNPAGEPVTQGHGDLTLRMRGEDTLRFIATVPDTLLWSREKPQFHTLRLRTQRDGRNMEYHTLPLGLRTLTMHEGGLCINNRKESLDMTNLAPNATLDEVELLRKTGVNTLRLLPGAGAERIYQLCDTMGLYVIAQAPIDTHHRGSSRLKGGNPSNDPAWKQAFIERAENTFHTAKRHPSVIGFSIGFDAANGICLYESYLHLKQQGDTRPILYFEAEGEWNNDELK